MIIRTLMEHFSIFLKIKKNYLNYPPIIKWHINKIKCTKQKKKYISYTQKALTVKKTTFCTTV